MIGCETPGGSRIALQLGWVEEAEGFGEILGRFWGIWGDFSSPGEAGGSSSAFWIYGAEPGMRRDELG